MRRFETDFWLPVPAERAFTFLADARNLDRVTPRWFQFEILTPAPIRMAVGTEIDYRLRWRCARLAWRSRVTDWRPSRQFAYEQAKGPFREFRHDHRFVPEAAGVRVVDIIDYRVPGGAAAGRFLVEPDLRRIFRHRRRRVEQLLVAGDAGEKQ